MTTETITLILRLAIVVMAGIIVPTIKHWIETRTENAQMDGIRQAAETAVYAAEQIYNTAEKSDPDGEMRRKYAHEAVSWAAKRAGICLTDSDIDAIIQAAVQELNLMKHGGLLNELISSEGEKDESMDS